MLCTSRCRRDPGWLNAARRLNGRERVSNGMEEGSVSMTKQSSMSGSVSPRKKGFATSVAVKRSTPPVGMPVESTGR